MMEYLLSLRKISGWILGNHNPNALNVMAEAHPPSPVSEDDNLSLGRLRVKPAMTIRRSVLVPSQIIFEF